MMQRTLCRVFRGTCRKWRENECPPVAVGEDVRKNKEQNEKEFVPPKHNLGEAVTWTTGLVLGYQLTHRRRRTLIEECPPATSATSAAVTSPSSSNSPTTTAQKTCPFTVASRVLSQPIFSDSTVRNVSRKCIVVPSIDITPFIHEDIQDEELPERLNSPNAVEDDDIVFASEADLVIGAYRKETANLDQSSITELHDPIEHGRKYAADLLSVLGAFEFLKTEGQPTKTKPMKSRRPKKKAGEPPLTAIELMERGAELGSDRALYNIGVAYERMNNINLAREYYKKAADVGHPLATYNCAVFALKDGHLAEGVALMKTASDFGVPEASEFMKPSGESLAVQFEIGKV